MLTIIAQALVTLHVFLSIIVIKVGFHHTDALPITSKPIESTAENLAWQAWIMMPPHEQNLEKSRKVTPKSIFLLPNRVKVPASDGQPWIVEAGSGSGLYAPIECPPGQRQFESRCISILDIDREQLLIQELQLLLHHGGINNNKNAYDYDYDYDEESIAALEANYKPPMMFKGDELAPVAVSGNFDDEARLPNEDAPLKFNIFSENYPTDTEMQHNQSTGMVMTNVNSSDPWSLAQFFGASPAPNVTSLSFAANGAKTHATETTITRSVTTVKTTELIEGFPVTDIEAIVLPAVATPSQRHEISFFKDDSGMQLVTTVSDPQNIANTAAKKQQQQTPQEMPSQLTDLLKFDSLLPLQSPIVAPSTPASILTTTMLATTATTATMKATRMQTPASTITQTTQSATSTRPQTTETANEEVATVTTNIPKHIEALLDADDRVDQVASQHQQKEERIRSVSSSDNSVTTLTATNEPDTITDLLPTTLLPAAATSTVSNRKQLDQTTTVEVPIEEAAEEAQELKKSKVEPVRERTENTNDDLYVSQATPLPTPRTASTQQKVVDHDNNHEVDRDVDLDDDDDADDDRFYYQPVDVVETTVDNVDASGQHEVGASTLSQLVPESRTTEAAKTTLTTTSATTISEIDVAAELRAINEMVKKSKNRQGAINKKTTAAAKATKSEIVTTTKATSRSKTSPTSKQQLAVTTESSVDSERVAATSASNETQNETGAATTIDTLILATTPASALTTISATTVVTTDEATATATATLWAKIMPLLTTTTTEIPATVVSTQTASPTEITSTSTTTSSINSNSRNSSLNNNNRSHRNSKITRIDKLSTNSLSDNAKKTATTTKRTTSGFRSKNYVVPLFQATSTELPFRPTISTAATTTTTEATNGGSFSPFWWLPAGWRLDRPTTGSSSTTATTSKNNNKRPVASAAGEPSLLLRFWSAFPGNRDKIKEWPKSSS